MQHLIQHYFPIQFAKVRHPAALKIGIKNIICEFGGHGLPWKVQFIELGTNSATVSTVSTICPYKTLSYAQVKIACLRNITL